MATSSNATLTHSHAGIRARLADLADTVRLWRRRSHQRRALARLGEYELHDMGLSTSDVFGELAKPFWRG
jgi:uncharacterized protein YjiS (DUF1127 family)